MLINRMSTAGSYKQFFLPPAARWRRRAAPSFGFDLGFRGVTDKSHFFVMRPRHHRPNIVNYCIKVVRGFLGPAPLASPLPTRLDSILEHSNLQPNFTQIWTPQMI